MRSACVLFVMLVEMRYDVAVTLFVCLVTELMSTKIATEKCMFCVARNGRMLNIAKKKKLTCR